MTISRWCLACVLMMWVAWGVSLAAAAAPTKEVGDPYPLDVSPVSGKKLDDKAKPIIYVHEGQELRFASQEEVEQFKADPKPYLEKVKELIIAQQLPFYPLDTCMVSGDKLGGDMGKAIDYVYHNRLIRFCCPMCIKTFNANPAKYWAKLDEAVIAKQKPTYPLDRCVVSGELLGDGAIDMVVANRLVRLCCDDCPKSVRDHPVKYLSKIPAPETPAAQ